MITLLIILNIFVILEVLLLGYCAIKMIKMYKTSKLFFANNNLDYPQTP
jgi:hypothetical protein